MSLPTSHVLPDDFNQLPPSQKRRIRRSIKNAGESEVQALSVELKRRSTPAFDFFLYALLGALIAGLAVLLDSPLLFVLAAVCAPFLTPLMGIALAPAIKSLALFLQSLVSLLISLLIFFGGGALAGFLTSYLHLENFSQLILITSSDLVSWVILSFSAILCTVLFVRRESKPRLIGVLLAYQIFLPVTAAGFNLITGTRQLWLTTLILPFSRLTIAALIAAFVFMILGLHPRRAVSWLMFLLLIAAATVMLIANLCGVQFITDHAAIFPIPTNTATQIPSPLPSSTPTPSPVLPTDTPTPTPTRTNTPTLTLTATLTPTPTPFWVIVRAENGAVIRQEPNYEALIVAYAQDGSLVQMLTETYQSGSTLWVKVIAENGVEGWIIHSLLVTATPSP